MGGLVGGIAVYIYLNAATIEVLAANADVVPLWSMWQVPFALPGAAAGALLGAVLGALLRRQLRRGRR